MDCEGATPAPLVDAEQDAKLKDFSFRPLRLRVPLT